MFFQKARKSNIESGTSTAAERRLILSSNSDFFLREAYKTLRTNTMFSLAGCEGCKTVLVTSSFQSEGKSITSLNLAISFAEAENRVVLIDCDLRRPKLARLLKKGSRAGLSNLLLDPTLLDKAIIPSGIDRLDVILAGNIPPNPSELLGSARMAALLAQLRERYDYVILDTPPVNMVTDAVVLASQCDGVLFAVRAGQSERGSVIHAIRQLEYAQVKILGFALCDVTGGGGGSGYRYRYKRYGYGYGYDYSSHTKSPDDASGEDALS